MGKRNEYLSSGEDEEDKIQRRIHRLKKKLDRQKEKRRKALSYRASSGRSSSKRSRSRSSRGDSRRRSTRRSISRYSGHRSPKISRARRSRNRSLGRGRSYRRTRSQNSTRRSRSRTQSRSSVHDVHRRSRSRYAAHQLSSRESSRQRSFSRSASHSSKKSSPRQSSSVHEGPPVPTVSNNDNFSENNGRIEDASTQPTAPAEVRAPDGNPQVTSAAVASAADNPIATVNPSVSVPEHEIELQQDVLEVIGARLESDKKCSAAVHKDIALRWAEILRNGLPAEEVKKLLEKYPPPENCTFISVPKLNTEIIAAIQETAIKRDKRIVEKQERLAACLAALAKAISISLKIEASRRIELLESLSEGSRLLASVHREESLARKSLVLANLNSSLKTTLSNTTVDEWLFGGDLENKIKSAKTLERTSKDLKPPAKPQQSKNTKNWKGPTRRSTFKTRPTTSGTYRRQSSNASESKKPPFRKEAQRYRRR